MASGVKVNPCCHEVFNDVKMTTKKTKKLPYAVFKMSDDSSEIVEDVEFNVAKKGKPRLTFTDLLQELPKEDGRYVVYDYCFTSKAGAETSKLLLLLWCPSKMTVKKKMLYASSKDALKKMINEEIPEFQCDDADDISEKEVEEKLKK